MARGARAGAPGVFTVAMPIAAAGLGADARGGNPVTLSGLSLFTVEQTNCIATKGTEGGIANYAALQHLNR